MPIHHLTLCHPLLLPSIFSSIRVFSNDSTLHIRWPKYWSFSFNISPSSEYSGLISIGIDCFDLLAVQGTLKNLIQLLTVQFSHSVMSDSVNPWTAVHQVFLSITNSWSLLKLMSIEMVMISNHLILCHPLLLLPSIFSSIRVFSNELALCIRWPKH